MNLVPRFVFPWALLLLALVPWTIWVGARIRSLSRGRKWVAILLRTAMLLCLIAALGGAELVKSNDKLAIFFLLDYSDSIPEGLRAASVQAITQACEEYKTSKDEVGVVVFGAEPSIELSVGPTMELTKPDGSPDIHSLVSGEQTGIAAAIRLALAAFPQGHMKRLVLFTDGNETQGSAIEELKLARSSGVETSVFPLEIGGVNEVRVRRVLAPTRVDAEEPFKLQVVVNAEQDCEGVLRVYQRLKTGKHLLQSAPVTLQAGDNAFLLPQELKQSGFYEYEAVIEVLSDTVMANNEGRAFTVIQGEPTVLYVEADIAHSPALGPALAAEGLTVHTTDPGGLPTSLAQFQNYDAVVLSNVSSTSLSSAQLHALESVVRDLGIGLVMIGGPDTFGAGGYHDTPVERALPVSMDLKKRKVMPQGALVLIMHTCEIPDGNAWAREIGLASLNVLSAQDLMGALAYRNGEEWLYEIQPVGDKSRMRYALNDAMIGDMPDAAPTLQMAYKGLTTEPAAGAAVKRVVLISDGDPGAPTAALLDKFVAAKISVSTVCICPHRPADQQMLQWVAAKTGGQYYLVNNPNNLPQIFTKEAAVVKRGLVIEKEFTPKPRHYSEVLHGLLDNGLPQLRGYVATTSKDHATTALVAEEDDPLLAHWRYGLGKSVAFTSDVTARWAADWLAWDGFNQFWSQAVRWALRDTTPTSFRVDTGIKDGMGYVSIDAVDDTGKYVNFLRPKGVVTGPAAANFARTDLEFMQTGPGLYEGTFPVDAHGVYMVNITYTREDGSLGMIPTGLALDYSREYEYTNTNQSLLGQVAELGGGGMLAQEGDVDLTSFEALFKHDLDTSPTVTPIWQWLVIVAACMFPVEIFVRRVVVDFHGVFVWVITRLRRVPGLRRILPEPQRRRAPVTGTYGAMAARTAKAGVQQVYTASASAALEGVEIPPDEEEQRALQAAAEGEAKQAEEARSIYTQQLLAAKERAIRKRSRKSAKDNEPAAGSDEDGTRNKEN